VLLVKFLGIVLTIVSSIFTVLAFLFVPTPIFNHGSLVKDDNVPKNEVVLNEDSGKSIPSNKSPNKIESDDSTVKLNSHQVTPEQSPTNIQPSSNPQNKIIPEPPTDNFLNIMVDGVQKKYYIREGYVFLFNNSWNFQFYSNKFNTNDSIFIYLPASIASGDSLELTPYRPGNWLTMPNFTTLFSYTTQKGNTIMIDGVADGMIKIKIDKWEGRGGYAIGNIEGTLTLNQVDKITFKNGNFKVKIQEKPY